MINRSIPKKISSSLLDILSYISLFLIAGVLFTGGYKGEICGIYINFRRLEIPLYLLLLSITVRYLITKESIIETMPVKILNNIKTYLLKKPFKTLFIFISIYLIYFKLLQHFSYFTYANDLSIFDYPIHFTLKGRFMYFPWLTEVKNFLGVHFWPIVIAIVPFYLIYDSPILLLVLQAIFAALALIPLLKIARDNGFNKEESVYLGIFFIFNLFMWRGFEYNFHIEMLYPFFILFASYTAFKKNYLLHTVFILLTLTVKEDAFFHCIMLELFLLIFSGNKKSIAIINIVIAFVYGAITLKIILPYLQNGVDTHGFLTGRYGHLGSGYSEIIFFLITHPLQLCKMIFRDSLFKIFLSFGFLPLLHLKLSIFGIPSLLVHFITDFPPQYNLEFYHSLPALPFFAISTIFALKKMNSTWRKRLLIALVIISLISFRTPGLLIPSSAEIKAHNIFSKFPLDEKATAQANIYPHLPRSDSLSIFPERTSDAKYVFLKLNRWHAILNMTRCDYFQKIIRLIDKERFVVEIYYPPFVILKKDTSNRKVSEETKILKKDLLKRIENAKKN